MEKEMAIKKLTKGPWAMFKVETQPDGTLKTVQNGLHLMVKHEEWVEIIQALGK